MTQRSLTISVDAVTKRFGSFAAVDDVSLEVTQGEVVGFVGENGAGKTTTIHMLLGLTSPTSGEIRLFDRKVTPSNAHASHKRIGFAAGDMELPGTLTGRQYLAFVLAQSSGDHGSRYDELVAAFRPQLDKRIGSLSRGNKQKIALVAAFVTEPELVVLDEPTSGLDPVMQDVFLDTVRVEAARGTTIFMSSHYLQEVAEVCSRVILMKHGRIVEDLSQQQLAQRSGKIVTLTSKNTLKAPPHAVRPTATTKDQQHVLTFGYTGDVAQLAKWIGIQRGLLDIEISENTLEDEFKHVYNASQGAQHE